MGGPKGPNRIRPPMRPPGEDGPPFGPGWGPPPPGGWGPPPPGGWGPPPEEWGPPPPGGWGPRPPGGWGPPPPGGWGPPPPGGWGPLPPEGWGPPPPPGGWGPRGPPDWGPRGPPPPGWPYPEDWLRHPDDWRPPHPDDWRPPHPDNWRPPHPDDWRPPPQDWGPPPWGPEPPPEPWGPDCIPPGPVPPPVGVPPPLPVGGPPVGVPPPPIGVPPPPIGVPPPPPVGVPPPDPMAFGQMPVPPVPPIGLPGYPPGWTAEPVVEEPMPNPPPDQPEWIKALISAPPTESTLAEAKKNTEESVVPTKTEPEPATTSKPKRKPKADPAKTAKALGLLGKRTFEKPPPGRSTGIISFIGPTFGYIEREDLEKFTFMFDSFFGNPKSMTPGVRVHFTVCMEKSGPLATDVKVAPGGTENVDTEIYEAVVSQPILEPQHGGRQYPGQVYTKIGPLRTNVTFDRKDSTVTLLKNDQVLINLLTDIVSEKRRATNIRPKIPSTFSSTMETREKGVIISLKDNDGVIKSEAHGEIPFDIKENFSDVDFTTEDINEEVEFTITELRAGKRAIRVQREKEPLLLTFCPTGSEDEDENENSDSHEDSTRNRKGKAVVQSDLEPHLKLDTDLYEGIVSQPVIDPTPQMQGFPGQIYANIGPRKTNVTFDHQDCGVTLLKNDHVLINLLFDTLTMKKRAANIKPKVPFTFSYTKEKRDTGIITVLGAEEGIVNSDDHGELPFDIDENFSDTEFSNKDIHQEVEFTVAMVKSKKKAIRLLRMKRSRDIILEEQKRREEEVKKKKREQEEGRKQLDVEKRMEEEHQKEAERKKKVEVAVALAAANSKWTPYGFKMRHPDSLDDISRERFEGTVLKAISRTMKKIKKEPVDGRRAEGGQSLFGQIKIKKENFDEDEEKEGGDKCGGEEEEMKTEVKEEHVEEREEKKNQSEGGKATVDPEKGRLVMTIDGEQKQLTFGPDDLLSTATMFDGDKVRFNIATHQETKEERATYVEILPDSFEESIEQRRHGIVIEFSNDSGLIKCAQNPQLYFHMSEVIEKKKLELNEKVEFSVVPHETADGGNQAIRIKRYTESVFLPARKLGGVGANKGKMTIKLTKPSEDTQTAEADKLKAVVKNLRTQDSKAIGSRRDYSAPRRRYSRSRSRSRSHSRTRAKSRSRSRSKSPPRDQYGRVLKKRRSTSIDRDRKSVRSRRSRSKERSKKRTKSHSKSSSRSRSRSRERSKDRVRKKRNKISKEHEESHKKRSDLSPPSRPVRLMEDELARKKRELEELNEMIAYKKSIVDRDTGQKTCIDYDHGRIAIPLTEYKPVRSILKKRTEGSEYPPRPSQAYDDPYYDRSFSPYQDQVYGDRYVDPYVSRPYSDRPYVDRSYESRPYGEPIYGAPRRYTDRYDVYDEPYDDRYQDLGYPDQRFKDPHYNVKQSQSPDDSLSTPQSASTQHTQATSSSHPPFRPPSPTDPPPRTPSPKLKNTTTRQSPLTEKPPLDRFLDMLNKKVDAEKNSEPVYVTDELLPHERALEDGKGFSRIVGMAHTEQLSGSLGEGQKKQPSPRRSSVERTSEESKMNAEPYDKIQSLLRTIGLKLSTGDVSKLASRAHEKIFSPSSSSTERLNVPSPKEQMRTNRTSSVELDHSHSPSPARSSSLEPLHRHTAVSEYEGFFDPQELEAFKKAQQLQSLTKTIRSTPPTSSLVKPPPGPPPAHFKHPPIPVDMPFGGMTQAPPVQPSTAFTMDSPNYPSDGQLSQRLGSIVGPPPGPSPRHPGQSPPGPPPGPPPRRSGQPPLGPPPGPPPWRPPGPPLFTLPTGHAAFPFIGEPSAAPPPKSGSPLADAAVTARSSTPVTSSSTDDDKSAISTTVARCLKVIETVKSLVVQPSAKQTKSVQFSLPTESSSVSSLQITTGADDDIKTKQKEKLDLYNQRILEKREQHYQEKLARKKQEKNKDGTPIPPEVPESSKPKNVWICGHSLVYWAESRAKSPEVGMQLGMDPSKVTIWWKGIQGMTWPQLLPQLHQLKITWPNPDVLIIHLGGNDMSTDSPTDLLASVKKDLTSMRSIFPQCILVWSNILPRRVWRHSTDSHEVDLVRTTVNRRIQSIVSDLGGTSLTHDNIRCGANTGLYRSDGVHLSPKGIDFFNLNLQDFLEKWEMAVEKN